MFFLGGEFSYSQVLNFLLDYSIRHACIFIITISWETMCIALSIMGIVGFLISYEDTKSRSVASCFRIII